MTESSNDAQVLSISYGAFSIRLEGFGDPFPVIKRVTEYFRQIAATDKSFGTLPLEHQHLEMGLFADTISAEGTDVKMEENQLVLAPKRQEGQIQIDPPANAAAAPEIIETPEPHFSPRPAAQDIPSEADRAAIAESIISAKNTVERDEEIRRRLDIIREQTSGISDKYDTAQEDDVEQNHAFLSNHEAPGEDDLVFIHPLKSPFKRFLSQNTDAMTGTDGPQRLQLSPDMRTIRIRK